MTLLEWVALLGFILTVVGTFVVYYTKLNVKIAEINREQLSMRKDFEEHKKNNKDEFASFKEEAISYRRENREDHQEIIKTMNNLASSISDLKNELIKIYEKH